MSLSEISLAIPVENVHSHPNCKSLEKNNNVVFTYLDVSDSTHTRQDSAIDEIKVEREREEFVKGTWLRLLQPWQREPEVFE